MELSGKVQSIISRLPHFYPPEDENSFFFQLFNIFGENLDNNEQDILDVMNSHFVDLADNFGSEGFTEKRKGDVDRIFALFLEKLGGTAQLRQTQPQIQGSEFQRFSFFIREFIDPKPKEEENPLTLYLWSKFNSESQAIIHQYSLKNVFYQGSLTYTPDQLSKIIANRETYSCLATSLISQNSKQKILSLRGSTPKKKAEATQFLKQLSQEILMTFVLRLKLGQDEISRFIKNQFSSETQQMLGNYDFSTPVPSLLIETLVKDLNNTIISPELPQKFNLFITQINLLQKIDLFLELRYLKDIISLNLPNLLRFLQDANKTLQTLKPSYSSLQIQRKTPVKELFISSELIAKFYHDWSINLQILANLTASLGSSSHKLKPVSQMWKNVSYFVNQSANCLLVNPPNLGDYLDHLQKAVKSINPNKRYEPIKASEEFYNFLLGYDEMIRIIDKVIGFFIEEISDLLNNSQLMNNRLLQKELQFFSNLLSQSKDIIRRFNISYSTTNFRSTLQSYTIYHQLARLDDFLESIINQKKVISETFLQKLKDFLTVLVSSSERERLNPLPKLLEELLQSNWENEEQLLTQIEQIEQETTWLLDNNKSRILNLCQIVQTQIINISDQQENLPLFISALQSQISESINRLFDRLISLNLTPVSQELSRLFYQQLSVATETTLSRLPLTTISIDSTLENTIIDDLTNNLQKGDYCQKIMQILEGIDSGRKNLQENKNANRWSLILLNYAKSALLKIFVLPNDLDNSWNYWVKFFLNTEVDRLLHSNPIGDDLTRLNRLLLDIVYKIEIPSNVIPSEETVRQVISEQLNQIVINNPNFYNEVKQWFNRHDFSREMKYYLASLQNKNASSLDNQRLNRLLLEIAYPLFLKKSDSPYRNRLKQLITVLKNGANTKQGIIHITSANLGMNPNPENIINSWETYLFDLPLELETSLQEITVSAEIQQAFSEQGIILSFGTPLAMEEVDRRWTLTDSIRGEVYLIRRTKNSFKVYRQLIRVIEYQPQFTTKSYRFSPSQSFSFTVTNPNYIATPITLELKLLDNRLPSEQSQSTLQPLTHLSLKNITTHEQITYTQNFSCGQTLIFFPDNSGLLEGKAISKNQIEGSTPLLPLGESQWTIETFVNSSQAVFDQTQLDFSYFDQGKMQVIQPEQANAYILEVKFTYYTLTTGTFNVIIPWDIPGYSDRFDETIDHPRHQIKSLIDRVRSAGISSLITYQKNLQEDHEIYEQLTPLIKEFPKEEFSPYQKRPIIHEMSDLLLTNTVLDHTYFDSSIFLT